MLSKTQISEKASAEDAPRSVQLIVHTKIFEFADGWNQLKIEPEVFVFDHHAFNFDYLLHVSGINYLVHPEDTSQIIWMIQEGIFDLVEFNFRFINRTGEIKSLRGLTRLVTKM